MSKLGWASLALLLFFLISCKSEYDQLVRSELASGVQNDSLIFDMSLGQTKKDFYGICWDLNSKQIISQGSGNQYARFDEPMDSAQDVGKRKRMDFFGIFDDSDVMRGMEMIFSYLSWAPWNEELFAEALVSDLEKKIMKEYQGNAFIKVMLKDVEKEALVKVDGNMQILMYPRNAKEVIVRMEDLNHKLKIK